MTSEAIQQVWLASLAIFVVVLLVVAALLTLILSTTKKIHAGVSAIWNVGQRVANNTIHLALLDRTNFLAAGMLESAGRIAAATDAIAKHADGCPGCPACVVGHPQEGRT
jgi:L-asparagine transporter-like permease